MRLYVIIVLCAFGSVRKASCQGSAEDTEVALPVGAWTSVCSDQHGNCNQDGDDREDAGESELAEADEADIYSEYDSDYGDYLEANEEAFPADLDEEQMNANGNLEEPIEEVGTISHRTMAFLSDASEQRVSESLRENSQEAGNEEEYQVDEDCEPIPDKRRARHQKRREKWKQRKRANTKMKDCCTKGKRMGLRADVYKSDNIFHACRDIVRYRMPKVAYRCQRIMQTCCENKALRRYYVHHKRPSG